MNSIISSVVTSRNTNTAPGKNAIETQSLNVYYGDFLAVKNVNLNFEERKIKWDDERQMAV